MKSEKNLVYDIIVATLGPDAVRRENITSESQRILREYGYERWKEGNDEAIHDYNDGGGW